MKKRSSDSVPRVGSSDQKAIGDFIRSLRERRGLTQAQFAQALKTTQSAVARMEAGKQNLSTAELSKVSEALDHKVIAIADSTDFEIVGPTKLSGSIATNTSKNGALALACASLLNKGKTRLRGIPRIEEMNRLFEIFESIGISVRRDGEVIEIRPPKKFNMAGLDVAAARRIRSVLMMIGPLSHMIPSFELPHAGGCKMGNRTIAAHRFALEDLGVSIATGKDSYVISERRIRTTKLGEVVMYESSDTATINAIMRAALLPRVTRLSFATPNYQVQEVCFFLKKLGVRVEGIGSTDLLIEGVASIDMDIEYVNSEDPIESMMFIAAAVATDSELTVRRCPIDFVKLELAKLEKMGLKYDISDIYRAENGETRLADVTVKPSKLTALHDKIAAQPYPGINTDNLPFFVPIVTRATGRTLVHDWMWENRAIYFTELNRLGASVTLADPHRVFIDGPTKLKAAQIVCPPALRPAVIILIAMLAAEGTSVLRNVYSIQRGYEEIADRLNSIGASIRVLKGM
jgi:UDP-N-acetylglucosamine 1-carboxyvinyltransferase